MAFSSLATARRCSKASSEPDARRNRRLAKVLHVRPRTANACRRARAGRFARPVWTGQIASVAEHARAPLEKLGEAVVFHQSAILTIDEISAQRIELGVYWLKRAGRGTGKGRTSAEPGSVAPGDRLAKPGRRSRAIRRGRPRAQVAGRIADRQLAAAETALKYDGCVRRRCSRQRLQRACKCLSSIEPAAFACWHRHQRPRRRRGCRPGCLRPSRSGGNFRWPCNVAKIASAISTTAATSLAVLAIGFAGRSTPESAIEARAATCRQQAMMSPRTTSSRPPASRERRNTALPGRGACR